jgi:sugar lactone lactonase YvrE
MGRRWLVVVAGALACSSSARPPGPDAALPDAAADGALPDATLPEAALPDAVLPIDVPIDVVIPEDAVPSPDGAVPLPDGAPPVGKITCGATSTVVTGAMDSLVVAPDGTIYYTDGAFHAVHRVRPGMPEERNWLVVQTGHSDGFSGITYDPVGRKLYMADWGLIKIVAVDLSTGGVPQPEFLTVPGGGFYALTLGEDRAIYFVDESTGVVHRYSIDGWVHTRVTNELVGQPRALAFGPDGWIYLVTSTLTTDVWRLKIENGHEVDRQKFAALGPGDKPPHGLAFDQAGNLYVSSVGNLMQINPAGEVRVISSAAEGGMDFGAGALPCGHLLLAGPDGLKVFDVGVPGLAVPWHRQP